MKERGRCDAGGVTATRLRERLGAHWSSVPSVR
jgi:hypothetical protein